MSLLHYLHYFHVYQLTSFSFFSFSATYWVNALLGKVDLTDMYSRNEDCWSSLPVYIGPKILANTVFHSEERQRLFFQVWVFFIICTNRSRTPKYEFSLVTPRQNMNWGLQRGEANALTYCTTKSSSLSNYHRTSPTAMTFSLPHRSKSELLSKVIHLSAGSGILWNKMTGAFPKHDCNTTDLLSGFFVSEIMTAFSFIQYHVISDLKASCKREKPQWPLFHNKIQVYSYYQKKKSLLRELYF